MVAHADIGGIDGQDVNGEFPVGDSFPSPSPWGKNFPIPIPVNTNGRSSSPISVPVRGFYPRRVPVPVTKSSETEKTGGWRIWGSRHETEKRVRYREIQSVSFVHGDRVQRDRVPLTSRIMSSVPA